MTPKSTCLVIESKALANVVNFIDSNDFVKDTLLEWYYSTYPEGFNATNEDIQNLCLRLVPAYLLLGQDVIVKLCQSHGTNSEKCKAIFDGLFTIKEYVDSNMDNTVIDDKMKELVFKKISEFYAQELSGFNRFGFWLMFENNRRQVIVS